MVWLTIIGWTISFILSIILYWLISNFRSAIKQANIDQIRMRNRFVLIMNVYEQLAEYLEGLKQSKLFSEAMLENEPAIKSVYDQFDLLSDTMWTVFNEEKKFRNVDLMISYDNEEEEIDEQN